MERTEEGREKDGKGRRTEFLRTKQMTALVNGGRRKRVISAIKFFFLIIFFLACYIVGRFRARRASISTLTWAAATAKVGRRCRNI